MALLALEESAAWTRRPRIPRAAQALIRQMCHANPTWGAPRIHGELLKLGITIAEATVGTALVHESELTRIGPTPEALQRPMLYDSGLPRAVI